MGLRTTRRTSICMSSSSFYFSSGGVQLIFLCDYEVSSFSKGCWMKSWRWFLWTWTSLECVSSRMTCDSSCKTQECLKNLAHNLGYEWVDISTKIELLKDKSNRVFNNSTKLFIFEIDNFKKITQINTKGSLSTFPFYKKDSTTKLQFRKWRDVKLSLECTK